MRKIYFLFFLPLFAIAQKDKGIHFEEGLSWMQVKDKAAKEGKPIFVDCFASWCGPCKVMDDSVYPKESVGEFWNAHFISVKAQMDSTSAKDQRELVTHIENGNEVRKYKILIFPSYLFFSPDGSIIHRSFGYRDEDELIALGKASLNPKKQYYTLLTTYYNGQKDDSTIRYLVQTALSINDSALAGVLAIDYMNNHLASLNHERIYTDQNIRFITSCMILGWVSPEDWGFKVFYRHEREVDSIMKIQTYAEKYVDYIIGRYKIDPFLIEAPQSKSVTPKWNTIADSINQEFGTVYADKAITSAKIRWFEWKKNWSEATRYTYALVENYGTDMDNSELNSNSWRVFLRSRDPEELHAAVGWIKRVLQKQPNWPGAIDTYANLLYKLGERKHAISEEQKALKLDPQNKDFQIDYFKMKKNEPTWESN